MSDETPQRPASENDCEGWKAYWAAQGMPWRTEPEIGEGRQQYLAERRAVQPDIEKGIYPFRDEDGSIRLTRADVEWLLATHESGGRRGPVDWDDPHQRQRDGLDLRGVDLREANLEGLPLACLRAGLRFSELHVFTTAQPEIEVMPAYEASVGLLASVAHLDKVNLSEAHLENACLHLAQLQEAKLHAVHLEGAMLLNANLERADLWRAHAEGAVASHTNFVGAQVLDSYFDYANLHWARFDGCALLGTRLEDADLRRVTFSATTVLNGIRLGSKYDGLTRVCDVVWNGVSVTFVHWVQERRQTHGNRKADLRPVYGSSMQELESMLQGNVPQDAAATRLLADQRNLRAHRQVSLLLREQGLQDEADRFAYRAQALQRRVYRLQRRPLHYFGSLLLDLMSGYGYKPLRAFSAYALVILVFTSLYLLNAQFAAPHLSWDESLVLSISSFHGRGFFTSDIRLGDTLARLAAGEAIVGLLIEITFIATFTRRFFAR